jgi:hypothetical protein
VVIQAPPRIAGATLKPALRYMHGMERNPLTHLPTQALDDNPLPDVNRVDVLVLKVVNPFETRIFAMTGSLQPMDRQIHGFLRMAPEVGFEPTTNRLTADRSTTELLRN